MTEPVKCPEGMVYIPEGPFEMGSTDGDPDEQPVRDVYISNFCMDKHEVTNTEYISQMNYSPSTSGFDYPNQPVVDVSWYEADAYCKAQGKRLPTEAEWEKAARGPEGHDDGKERYRMNFTMDVCSFGENGYGLCDIVSNVWEWVLDWYADDAYRSKKTSDPQGPSDGDSKVLRGGSWPYSAPRSLRAADRYKLPQDFSYYIIGFRCVADPLPSEE